MKSNNSNDSFKKLIKESGLESPSIDFTSIVMKSVVKESKLRFTGEPAFNRNQILFFISLFSLLIVYSLFSGSTYSGVDLTRYQNNFTAFLKLVSSPMLLLLIVSGWLLYMFDKVVARRIFG